MAKMLDILEAALCLQGFQYVRLDGGTKTEFRQPLVEYFNNNPKLFCFISSTRSGGIGLNLTSADTVIFYDSDWNPAIDRQAQVATFDKDRCHRIGQTRDVTIYRLISEHTIEENILMKNIQKTQLDTYVMEKGEFNQETLSRKVRFSHQFNMRDILGDVLGDNFKNITLKGYTKALKKVEDKEDYETGNQTLKDTEEQREFDEDLDDGPQGVDQIIDISKISAILPPIYIYGLKMIEGYSGNSDAFKDLEDEPDNDKQSHRSADSRDSDNNDDQDDKGIEMRPPEPLDRVTTLAVIKDEKARFQKYYGFNPT